MWGYLKTMTRQFFFAKHKWQCRILEQGSRQGQYWFREVRLRTAESPTAQSAPLGWLHALSGGGMHGATRRKAQGRLLHAYNSKSWSKIMENKFNYLAVLKLMVQVIFLYFFGKIFYNLCCVLRRNWECLMRGGTECPNWSYMRLNKYIRNGLYRGARALWEVT